MCVSVSVSVCLCVCVCVCVCGKNGVRKREVRLFVSITGYSLLRATPREWIFACTAVCTPASRAVVLRLRGDSYADFTVFVT